MTQMKAIVGEMQYKTTPDARATVEAMALNKWYKFGKEHYHQWIMMQRNPAKKYDYTVQVKQINNEVYVRKISKLVAAE